MASRVLIGSIIQRTCKLQSLHGESEAEFRNLIPSPALVAFKAQGHRDPYRTPLSEYYQKFTNPKAVTVSQK